MSDMVFRARRAADVAGDVYLASLPTRLDQRPAGWRAKLAEVRMRAAGVAALDPHDSELQNIILGAMGFVSDGPKNYSPMARVQAHDAIAALRAAVAQGESR